MDGYLKKNLDKAKEVIKKDWDMVFAVDGMEGSGKSVLAMQCAYYCDPTLTLDRIVFTADEFKTAIKKAKQYEAIIFDEAFRGLTGKQTMSRINQSLVKMIAEIRQKNLFVFVVMPTFFDLEKYVALWRSRALIHVYTGDQFERGRFAFFNTDRKKTLYVLGKKFYSYGKAKANFFGKFTNKYPIDEEGYRKKKAKVLSSTDEEEGISERLIKRYVIKKFCELEVEDQRKIKKVSIATLLGVDASTITYYLNLFGQKSSESKLIPRKELEFGTTDSSINLPRSGDDIEL